MPTYRISQAKSSKMKKGDVAMYVWMYIETKLVFICLILPHT